MPPALYARAFGSLSGIRFYSLQVDGEKELATMASDGLDVVDCTKELKSFDESAALVGNLNLVITVCTSVAHLSGALGVPTRLLLDVDPVSIDADLPAATVRRLVASARTDPGRFHDNDLKGNTTARFLKPIPSANSEIIGRPIKSKRLTDHI
ncbi:hypothetical protein OKW41_002988 [Paraburkholderia sp. UCT70]|uniref:hypothetical protein n=1 Tax=Paraburkholderia sp. UCT70 TaxID=2991068 RepID=UPI003D1C2FDE